jgi:hypothetical protein
MALTQVNPGLLDSNAQYTGFKNRIINGGMRVSQRGTVSVSAGSPAYTLDRWRINPTGASTSVTQGTVGFGNQTYALQLNGATSLTNVEVQQRIEQANCYDLLSTNVTVSFWMYTNKSTGVSGAQLSLVAPSAADNWSSQISGSATTYTIPSFAQNTATFVSYTFTTNANVANGLGILINTNTATVSGEWVQITGVQLEKGSTATSFDYRPYGTELQLCQRYYEKSYSMASIAGASTNTGKGSFNVGAAANTFWRWTQNYRVSKRADSTFTIYSTTGASGNVRLNNASDLAVSTEDAGENATAIFVSRNASLGDFFWWQWTASAEL